MRFEGVFGVEASLFPRSTALVKLEDTNGFALGWMVPVYWKESFRLFFLLSIRET